MARTRAVFVAPSMALGGAERQMYLLMRALNRDAFAPVLVTLNAKGEFFERASADGFECHYLDVHGHLPLRGFWRLVRILRNPRSDVVMMRGFNASVLGRLAAAIAGVSTRVVSEHSTGWVGQPRWFNRIVDRALVPLTSMYVAVANVQVDFLAVERGLPRSRIVVVHNGIELLYCGPDARESARARLGISESAFVVGIVAVLRPEKDHGTFLMAARSLMDRVPHARFVIVGDGPCRTAVEELACELGLGESLIMTGARTDAETLMPAFDVFTLSSYTVETFPMSALEAMACGVPVVATSVGGLPEMITDGQEGMLVSPREPQSLAAAWLELALDECRRRAMGLRAQQRVADEFTATLMACQYADLFARLVDQAGNDGRAQHVGS